ncbi:Exonuclease VII small subunit [Coriobacterium glomerans PW2]|uniref:Exonuclease VII small subunit n=1 Tax=Coriobacterium glomerans (strain ATCC 49209 / DSM 20642 / JCM 10262 / PW2) TaxID=700015 RepID=F2N7Z1_CORGP|nr:exodeoxyribonuclease VII small subunit [Coriobacterium glomerans]AEB07100.1 Exonuclease VII small subunit [Coriobacterium glomerans PW2]
MAQTPTHSFDDITARLDEIIGQVRSKDTSLERSLDLFDEAIALGSKAVEMVDTSKLSDREVADLTADAARSCEDTDRKRASVEPPEATAADAPRS